MQKKKEKWQKKTPGVSNPLKICRLLLKKLGWWFNTAGSRVGTKFYSKQLSSLCFQYCHFLWTKTNLKQATPLEGPWNQLSRDRFLQEPRVTGQSPPHLALCLQSCALPRGPCWLFAWGFVVSITQKWGCLFMSRASQHYVTGLRPYIIQTEKSELICASNVAQQWKRHKEPCELLAPARPCVEARSPSLLAGCLLP